MDNSLLPCAETFLPPLFTFKENMYFKSTALAIARTPLKVTMKKCPVLRNPEVSAGFRCGQWLPRIFNGLTEGPETLSICTWLQIPVSQKQFAFAHSY